MLERRMEALGDAAHLTEVFRRHGKYVVGDEERIGYELKADMLGGQANHVICDEI